MRRSRSSQSLHRSLLSLSVAASLVTGACASSQTSTSSGVANSDPNYVQIVRRETDRRVDVLVGGKPFTSYIWPTTLMKPVLFPLRSANGTVVTRGFPMEPRPKERIDHPHHVGLWFNYGDVNGLDFWNNSTAIKAADAPKMGTIVQKSIRDVKSGAGSGSLEVSSDWVNSQGQALLREDTRYVFTASDGVRAIERITTLTALGQPVSFKDNKEGMIGIRVARALEHPSLTPDKFTDASGRVTDVSVMDTVGVNGRYVSSEGKEGDAVWGTRAKWTMLSGNVSGSPVTLAVLDHPRNVGYPTYWHARGYGLFAANPLGQKAMSNGKEELNFSLAAGKSTTFRHRILILDGKATPTDLERHFAEFAK